MSCRRPPRGVWGRASLRCLVVAGLYACSAPAATGTPAPDPTSADALAAETLDGASSDRQPWDTADGRPDVAADAPADVAPACTNTCAGVIDDVPICWEALPDPSDDCACALVKSDDLTWCDDGDLCTTLDLCVKGECEGNNPVVCDAAPPDPCLGAPVCDPGTGECSSPPVDGAPCDDGDLCTLGDVCGSGACAPGAPTSCTPTASACEQNACDPLTGSCVISPSNQGQVCDDGDLCTDADTCADGQCAGAGVECDDDDACTVDTCDPSQGCVFTADPALPGCGTPACTPSVGTDEHALNTVYAPSLYRQEFARTVWNPVTDDFMVVWGVHHNPDPVFYDFSYRVLDRCLDDVHPEASIYEAALGEDGNTWASHYSSVAVDPSTGDYVVGYHSWCEGGPECTNSEVFIKRFHPSGDYAGPRLHVNEEHAGVQGWVDIDHNASGQMVSTYASHPGATYDIYVKSWDGAVVAQPETFFFAGVSPPLTNAVVALADDGTYVLTWVNANQPYVQRFDLGGAAVSPQVQVNAGSGGVWGHAPDVAMAADGSFVVVWSAGVVQFQRFAADVSPQGGVVELGAGLFGGTVAARVAMRTNGDFVVVWGAPDGDGQGIWAATFNADSTPKSAALLVNQDEVNNQTRPDAAFADDGDILVVWSSWDASDDTSDLKARVLVF